MIFGNEKSYIQFKEYFESESLKYFSKQSAQNPELEVLWKSMQYTYFLDGKRFRPYLCFLTAELFHVSFDKIFPFAMAIECVHTYSLIHDDLPCLDNDDLRRGKPTNHKVFGEAVALLAGDALLTEAFKIVTTIKNQTPDIIFKIIQLLSEKLGANGMVGGQVLDMLVSENISMSQLETIHLLKTACLIESSVIGAAIISGCNSHQEKSLSKYASTLGVAFQIKDDLLDGLESDQDYKNYIRLLGVEKTILELKNKTDQSKMALVDLGLNTTDLYKVLDYNLERKK